MCRHKGIGMSKPKKTKVEVVKYVRVNVLLRGVACEPELRGGIVAHFCGFSYPGKYPVPAARFLSRRAPVRLEHPWHGGQAASFAYAPAGTRRQMAMGASGMDRLLRLKVSDPI